MTKPRPTLLKSLFMVGEAEPSALFAAADALVIDETQLDEASQVRFSGFLDRLAVLIDPADTDHLAETLALAVKRGVAGVILAPRCRMVDVQKADVLLSASEAAQGLALGTTRIIATVGDVADSLLAAGRMAGASARLLALAGSGHQLAQSLNVENGAAPVTVARGLVVLTAASAGVLALAEADEGLSGAAFEKACLQDRADGYCGKFVTSPEQVETANRVFGNA